MCGFGSQLIAFMHNIQEEFVEYNNIDGWILLTTNGVRCSWCKKERNARELTYEIRIHSNAKNNPRYSVFINFFVMIDIFGKKNLFLDFRKELNG